MARSKTCEIYKKIQSLLGSNVPVVERLGYLDDSIWKFELLRGAKKNVKADFTYKKKIIFGYSQVVHNEVEVKIDDEILERIIDMFEEEYEKQVEVCEKLISKLER